MVIFHKNSLDLIGLEALFLFRGRRRAPELPDVHVSYVESLDKTGKKTYQTFYQYGKKRGVPGENGLLFVVDSGKKRSAPLTLPNTLIDRDKT